MDFCPCGSGEEYAACCKQYHLGKDAESAVKLMRARYSAYALNIPDYVMRTTHPKNSSYKHNQKMWRKELTVFSKRTIFKKLEILAHEENDNQATVSFIAYLEQDGHDASFQEKSLFLKVHGTWLYLGGEISKPGD